MRFGKSRKNGKKSNKSRTTVCIIITAAIFVPYRTFLEVPQPASDFVFRISEGRGGAPAFKLVAADGGLWKSQAVDNVKNYLVKALADVPDREKITIIA